MQALMRDLHARDPGELLRRFIKDDLADEMKDIQVELLQNMFSRPEEVYDRYTSQMTSLMQKRMALNAQSKGATAPVLMETPAFIRLMQEKSALLFQTWTALHTTHQRHEAEITRRWNKVRLGGVSSLPHS